MQCVCELEVAQKEKMQNLVVCFAGGSGGNFIASLCQFLIYQKSNRILEDGSAHSFYSRYQKHSYLSGRLLDPTPASYSQEYNTITDIPDVDIIVGHFRNLALLQKTNKRVIYIEFQPQHAEEIKRRLAKKVVDTQLTKQDYEVLSGADWPSWDEYQQGAEVAELNPNGLGLVHKDPIADWYYILPVDQTNICKITFDEILQGYELVDKLADFLKVTDFDKDKIRAIINEYRGKQ